MLLYLQITFEYDTGNICLTSPEERKIIEIPDFLIPLTTREFWLTWFNNEMCMGLKNQPPFLTHQINSEGKTIGFIKLKVTKNINWDIKCNLSFTLISVIPLHIFFHKNEIFYILRFRSSVSLTTFKI